MKILYIIKKTLHFMPAKKSVKTAASRKTVAAKKMSTPDPIPPRALAKSIADLKAIAGRRYPGIPPMVMQRNSEIMENFIRKYNLKPVDLPASTPSIGLTAKAIELDPWWTHGGLLSYHIHYEDKVYILTEPVWNDFSRQVLREVGTTLANAKTVSVEAMKQYSAAVSPIIDVKAGKTTVVTH